ncbi:DUF11 domain-containing protein [Rosistilla oblonga]|uniref:DUF11 domain-containing protein n=1 Tax=Rosistilla oblonga TaxID=2527990 RepID=UPI003A97009F
MPSLAFLRIQASSLYALGLLGLSIATSGCQSLAPAPSQPMAQRASQPSQPHPAQQFASAPTAAPAMPPAPQATAAGQPAAAPNGNAAAGVALVTHQQLVATPGGQTEVTAPTYTPDNYPGVYETAGFRNRLSSGLAGGACTACNGGCATCMPDNTGCACCGTAQCPTPMICQFPGDPNEYLCDGGDRMPSARVLLNNDVGGLGLEDTIVHYETQDGLTYVEPSNRVCVYAPRFAAVRKVTSAVTGENVLATQRVDLPRGPIGIDLRQPSSAVMQPLGPERNVRTMGPDALRDRNRGVPAENVVQPLLAEDVIAVLAGLSIIEQGVLRDADKPWLAKAGQAAIAWSSEEGAQVVIDEVVVGIATNDQKPEELKIFEVGKGRVRLIKLADKQNALPGEFVHFVLRFDNVGDQPVSNVAILDNLTTRLEYVEGSQTCTKGANFSAQDNEGQSLRLRWELTETLGVGEGCVIRFKCKVR